MAILQPWFALALLGALALAGYGGTRLTVRHGTLARLRTVLGEMPGAGAQPVFLRALHQIGLRLPGGSDDKLKALLMTAGYFQPAALPVFVALRLIGTGAVFFAILLRHGLDLQAKTVLLALFAAFFFSRLCVIMLKLKGEARQSEIRREFPPVVDVLLMVLNSGVSIDQCLRYVTGMLDQTAPLVSVIFRRTIADIDAGMPYEAAFQRMGQRLGIDEGYDLANMISQSLLQGGEITASLERFAADVAEKRVNTSREEIGRKSIYLTIVMLAFFMPVLLTILAGPAVSNIMDTLKVVKQQMHNKGQK